MRKSHLLQFIFFVFLTCNLFPSEEKETIVMIHGILGAPWNMCFFKKHLSKNGRDVIYWKYPSRNKTIKNHGKDLAIQLNTIAQEKPDQKINFIAHSLGGLVLRSALNEPNCPNEAKIGKTVLLATPNQGTCWARYLNKYTLVKKYLKEFSAKELMTKSDFNYLGDFPEKNESACHCRKLRIQSNNWQTK